MTALAKAASKGWDIVVYLCVTDDNYCHAVFSTLAQARRYCNAHPTFYIVKRTLDKD